jgi:hypothetical protein
VIAHHSTNQPHIQATGCWDHSQRMPVPSGDRNRLDDLVGRNPKRAGLLDRGERAGVRDRLECDAPLDQVVSDQ